MAAAKRVLMSPTDDPEKCRSTPLSSILLDYMLAVCLVMDQDSSWLESMASEWWDRWCWYILRELHPRLHGEPEVEKASLFRLLHFRASARVRSTIAELAATHVQESQSLLTGLLELFESVLDPELDGRLADLIREGTVGADRTWQVTQFLLRRDYDRAMLSCRVRLQASSEGGSDDLAIEVASALFYERTSDTWSLAISFLRNRPDLARRVLANYAHAEPGEGHRARSTSAGITPDQVGQVAGILLEQYPPESVARHYGAFWVTEDDSAVQLRHRLINWLGEQKTAEALEALKKLEQQFGGKYPWLRRPRSAVERAYRQSLWSPIPPAAVASLLAVSSKRLIRTGPDAVEGVVAAIEQYEWSLRHASPSDLEDLWNTPRGAPPTPKDEERISDKLCESIRRYFREHAIAAEREVQVFRRKVPRKHGGARGSEVDVLVRVSASGTSGGDPIAIPIEVKRSDNGEARTGLREQLLNRYMSELGTTWGYSSSCGWMPQVYP